MSRKWDNIVPSIDNTYELAIYFVFFEKLIYNTQRQFILLESVITFFIVIIFVEVHFQAKPRVCYFQYIKINLVGKIKNVILLLKDVTAASYQAIVRLHYDCKVEVVFDEMALKY